MARARLLFVTSERLIDWPRPGIAPTDAESPVPLSWSAWRLIGGNNREIARSARVFDNFIGCYQAVRDVQCAVTEGRGAARLVNADGMWAWRYEVDGVAEVTSGRRYLRQRECSANIQAFLDLVALATTPYDSAFGVRQDPVSIDAVSMEPVSMEPVSIDSVSIDLAAIEGQRSESLERDVRVDVRVG